MPEFVKVAKLSDMQKVADLAFNIWNEHYVPIIGQAQVDYMLAKFQSRQAIQEQIDNGSMYYLLRLGDEDIGYFSVNQLQGKKALELSKLYIYENHRGKKIGREAIEFIQYLGRELGAEKILLSVNKYNPSIYAYESMGFCYREAVVQDIGGGFVMDDYVYEKRL